MRHAADRDVGRFDRWAQTYDQDALQERFFRPMQAQTLALVANLGLQRKVDTLSAQADADDVVAWLAGAPESVRPYVLDGEASAAALRDRLDPQLGRTRPCPPWANESLPGRETGS